MIIIIDNYDSFTYNLYQSIMPFYANTKIFRNDSISVKDLLELHPSGIILSPGPGRPENAGICVDLIRQINANTPLLGVCLGHQAIAAAFGGNIIQAPDIMHGKSDMIFHQRKNIYQDIPLPFQAGRYHSLIADRETLPDVLSIEAENAAGHIMGIRHIKRPIFGIQFHPESILTPDGDQLLKNFVNECEQYDIKRKH